MFNIDGTYKPEFRGVFELFRENIKSKIDLGSSFAVFKNGEALIDLFGGYASRDEKRIWNKKTIVNTYSVSKGITNLCIANLIELELLDLEKPISFYSNKFNQRVHNDMALRKLFSHQAGMYGWKRNMKTENLYDFSFCINLLAQQEPFHKPGDETCYHVTTSGFLNNEILKQISGHGIGNNLKMMINDKDEIQCYFGVPDHEIKNISEIKTIDSERKLFKEDRYNFYARNNPKIPSDRTIHKNMEWIKCEISSSNCHSNARSIAKIYDKFINRIFSNSDQTFEGILKKIQNIESSRMDYVLRLPIKWSSLGFILDGGKLFGDSKNAFGHTGWGGSVAFADPDRKIGIAYITNSLSDNVLSDKRALKLIEKTYEILRIS